MSTTEPTRSDSGFVKLAAASTISNLGDGVVLVALPLLATQLTRDPTAIGGLLLAMRLPWLVCSLFAGALADRVDRRQLMWRVDVVRCLALSAFAAGVATDHVTMTMLYTLAIVLGIGETFRDNAAQVIVPSLVRDTRLEWANGRIASLETVTNRFIGPPLGGLLAGAAIASAFVFDAATFAAAAILVAAIPGTFRPPNTHQQTTVLAGIRDGLAWLWHHRQLRTLALLLGALTCLATAGEAILVLYAQQILGLGEVGYGALISAAALGAVSGGILSSRIVDRVGRSTALVSAALTYSIAQLGLGLADQAWIFAPVMALGAFSAVTWNVVTVSLRQALVPDELRGRVNSAYRFFGWGAMPIGALLGALLANATNLHAPFIVGGLGMITATIIATPHLTHIDQGQINQPPGATSVSTN
ncbi:MAG TPA: MFS transporter [Ilumatobacteraceae bacterium]|nr:MFS transporter [Ilumatobacteraceae bacterium]